MVSREYSRPLRDPTAQHLHPCCRHLLHSNSLSLELRQLSKIHWQHIACRRSFGPFDLRSAFARLLPRIASQSSFIAPMLITCLQSLDLTRVFECSHTASWRFFYLIVPCDTSAWKVQEFCRGDLVHLTIPFIRVSAWFEPLRAEHVNAWHAF